jgi:hypothetical protein
MYWKGTPTVKTIKGNSGRAAHGKNEAIEKERDANHADDENRARRDRRLPLPWENSLQKRIIESKKRGTVGREREA